MKAIYITCPAHTQHLLQTKVAGLGVSITGKKSRNFAVDGKKGNDARGDDVRATLRQDVKQYFSVSDAGPHP